MNELLRRQKISESQAKKYNIVGKKFGRLLVLNQFVKNKTRYAHCKCDCGNEVDVKCYHLKIGKTKSCGCLLKEKYNEMGKISKGILYPVWNAMKQRCYNPKQNCYNRYGGRGISVCKEWFDYNKFEEWSFNNGYKKGLTIDRIDVNGNYCPENCRWATKKEQARNTRNNRFIIFDGIKKPVVYWCELFDLSYYAVIYRLNNGWDINKALKTKTPTGFKKERKK